MCNTGWIRGTVVIYTSTVYVRDSLLFTENVRQNVCSLPWRSGNVCSMEVRYRLLHTVTAGSYLLHPVRGR